MRQCRQGHIYPDLLSACPVCEQRDDLQTLIRGLKPKDKNKGRPHPEKTTSTHYLFRQRSFAETEKANLDPSPDKSVTDAANDDKTVVIRRSHACRIKYLAGWLVELGFYDQPIQSYQLFNTRMTIGRERDNDIVIASATVSRHHCHIEYLNGKLVLYDDGSANPTQVDRRPVQSCCLKESHLISIGKKNFKIKYL